MTSRNDALAVICSGAIRPSIKDEPNLVAKVKKAFALVQDFWMSTDDDLRFRGALAAVILESEEADRTRITRSLDALRAVALAANGVPIDLAQVMATLDGIDPVPLQGLWLDAKEAHAASRGQG